MTYEEYDKAAKDYVVYLDEYSSLGWVNSKYQRQTFDGLYEAHFSNASVKTPHLLRLNENYDYFYMCMTRVPVADDVLPNEDVVKLTKTIVKGSKSIIAILDKEACDKLSILSTKRLNIYTVIFKYDKEKDYIFYGVREIGYDSNKNRITYRGYNASAEMILCNTWDMGIPMKKVLHSSPEMEIAKHLGEKFIEEYPRDRKNIYGYC